VEKAQNPGGLRKECGIGTGRRYGNKKAHECGELSVKKMEKEP
jgi:hypothetical protein